MVCLSELGLYGAQGVERWGYTVGGVFSLSLTVDWRQALEGPEPHKLARTAQLRVDYKGYGRWRVSGRQADGLAVRGMSSL